MNREIQMVISWSIAICMLMGVGLISILHVKIIKEAKDLARHANELIEFYNDQLARVRRFAESVYDAGESIQKYSEMVGHNGTEKIKALNDAIHDWLCKYDIKKATLLEGQSIILSNRKEGDSDK